MSNQSTLLTSNASRDSVDVNLNKLAPFDDGKLDECGTPDLVGEVALAVCGRGRSLLRSRLGFLHHIYLVKI